MLQSPMIPTRLLHSSPRPDASLSNKVPLRSRSLSPSVPLLVPDKLCQKEHNTSRPRMTSTRRRNVNVAVLLLVIFHATTAFVATTSNRFCSRTAAGAAHTELPGGSAGIRGAETKIAAAKGFFENLLGGLKVGVQGIRLAQDTPLG